MMFLWVQNDILWFEYVFGYEIVLEAFIWIEMNVYMI